MKKNTAILIDELIVTEIKIFHLMEKRDKNGKNPEDDSKLDNLKKHRLDLRKSIDGSKTTKKSLSTLVDELTVTNIKIFHLVDKVLKDEHTREDAKKAQDLNHYRSQLCNALNREFKQRENIRV